MQEHKSKDFADLIRTFNGHKVRFVIIGAHAVAFHGYARGTKDLDILIDPAPKNITRVLAALEDFGFGSLGLRETDFTKENVVQLGVAPNRVDLLSEIAGVRSNEIWRTR
ncbi:MAG: hypothetical protein AABZ44_07545, partial [Elusimicrobiota bacterium]